MNNRTKVILGAIVALFAISLVFRFVVLSQVGVAGGWIFYLGLPIGGIIALLVLLLRLGLLNFGESPSATVQHWQHNTAVQAPAPASPPPAASQRLDELETLRTNGIISDTQYAAERARIICW
jgi:uncharacterized oligopeptide transporter (OPT) family protein